MDPAWASALVSAAGLLLAWATITSNAKRDKERLEHERTMQRDRFSEERALRLRDTAFGKLSLIRQAAPVRVVFLYALDDLPVQGRDRHVDPSNANSKSAVLRAATRELDRAWNEIVKAHAAAQWFHDRGWTPEIRAQGGKLVTAIGDHDMAVWERMMLYGRGQTELATEDAWLGAVNEQNSGINKLANQLADLLRES